ncbi:MAG TPA: DUF547 domain-containing protein [Phycisphaerae bacterium]|nr:DUF547 domain-containing protein [Phycisphaerae bacterium]
MTFPFKQIRSIATIVIMGSLLVAGAPVLAWDAPVPQAATAQTDQSWSKFLQNHVSHSGLVDYKSAKTDADLIAFVGQLADFDLDQLKTSDERKAFWINAYNALAIYGVTLRLPNNETKWESFSVVEQPIEGLPASKGFFVGIRFEVGKIRLTLDDIEKKFMLRQWDDLDASKREQFERLAPDQGDPRIHFALVCCALGCPVLSREPFVAERLDEQLNRATQSFLTDKNRSQFEATKKNWSVSELIQWYQSDLINPKYKNSSRSVLTFAADNVQDSSLARSLRTDTWRVSYLKYDWRLNNWRR